MCNLETETIQGQNGLYKPIAANAGIPSPLADGMLAILYNSGMGGNYSFKAKRTPISLMPIVVQNRGEADKNYQPSTRTRATYSM